MRLEKKKKKVEDEFDTDIETDIEDDLKDDDFSDIYGDNFLGDFEGNPPIQKHQDLLKDLTNFSPYIREAFNNWLGLMWDENKGKFVRNPALRPIMNERGAAWCIGFLKTYTRSNNIITNISQEEYRFMMGDIIENVWLNLGTRADLGITNDGDLIRVCNEIEHAAALILMGAGDGKYNRLLSTTVSRTESVNLQQPNQLRQQEASQAGFLTSLKKSLMGEK